MENITEIVCPNCGEKIAGVILCFVLNAERDLMKMHSKRYRALSRLQNPPVFLPNTRK
mgnify:CR=1 FL=1